jgi:hypothetical protein
MSLRDSCQAQTTTFRHRRHNMTRFQRWKRQGLTRREQSRYHQTANQRTRRICWREQSIRPVNRKQTVAPPFHFHRIGQFFGSSMVQRVKCDFVTIAKFPVSSSPASSFNWLFNRFDCCFLTVNFFGSEIRPPVSDCESIRSSSRAALPIDHFFTTVHLFFTRISTKTHFKKPKQTKNTKIGNVNGKTKRHFIPPSIRNPPQPSVKEIKQKLLHFERLSHCVGLDRVIHVLFLYSFQCVQFR